MRRATTPISTDTRTAKRATQYGRYEVIEQHAGRDREWYVRDADTGALLSGPGTYRRMTAQARTLAERDTPTRRPYTPQQLKRALAALVARNAEARPTDAVIRAFGDEMERLAELVLGNPRQRLPLYVQMFGGAILSQAEIAAGLEWLGLQPAAESASGFTQAVPEAIVELRSLVERLENRAARQARKRREVRRRRSCTPHRSGRAPEATR